MTGRDLKEYYKLLGKDTLGRSLPKAVGWTVSLPTKFKVPQMTTQGGRRLRKIDVAWCFLTPNQQIVYLTEKYLKIIESYVEKYLAVFELNKAGCVHMHLICYDSGIQNDYALASLRANIRQEPLCMKIAGSNMNRHRVLNFIHWISDVPKWIEYMQKDLDKHDYPILLHSGETT